MNVRKPEVMGVMPLVPYNPFRDLENMFGDFPELLEGEGGGRTPKVDLYETDNNVVAEFELPGVKADNINIQARKDSLEVEAKEESKKEDKENEKGYYRKETRRGYYKRVIPLPVEVKEDKAKADYKEGVLKVTMPKAQPKKQEEEKGKKVEVKKS